MNLSCSILAFAPYVSKLHQRCAFRLNAASIYLITCYHRTILSDRLVRSKTSNLFQSSLGRMNNVTFNNPITKQ